MNKVEKKTKQGFVKFMSKNNCDCDLINRFNDFPEKLIYKGDDYNMTISINKRTIGESIYNFDINYFSISKLQLLFPYKYTNSIKEIIEYVENNLSQLFKEESI